MTLNFQSAQPAGDANRFRPQYRELARHDFALIKEIKETAEKLARLMESQGGSRYTSLAITNLEQSVMWAVKAITG